MPEVAIYEDHYLRARKHDIWSSGERLGVFEESQSSPVQFRA